MTECVPTSISSSIRPRDLIALESNHVNQGRDSALPVGLTEPKTCVNTKGEYKDHESCDTQSTIWWFTSSAFPLLAGTFGPIANLFSVCALSQRWRIAFDLPGHRVSDRSWIAVLNGCSLAVALIANIFLLFNFTRRVRYAVAQPITISLWYIASIFLAVPVGLSHIQPRSTQPALAFVYSQSYFYAIISACLYFTISTLLLLSMLGATVFHKYPASFAVLTAPQRTLMLQTMAFALYLSLGAGVFGAIENWSFADGIYWADYTLLTIGLGTDFPLTTTLGRMILIPYAAIGITSIGLVVASVRALVLERASAKVVRRHLGKSRETWKAMINSKLQPTTSKEKRRLRWRGRKLTRKETLLLDLPSQLSKCTSQIAAVEAQRPRWSKAEFELMRLIEESAERKERYMSLGVSFLVILVVWFGGSVIFWVCEHVGKSHILVDRPYSFLDQKSQGWTYPESIYFTYTTLLTIGYGDFYPNSPSGKPFFVLWSLISVPAMTVFISNMGNTVVKWVQDGTGWIGKWTILSESDHCKSIFHSQSSGGNPNNLLKTEQRGVLENVRFEVHRRTTFSSWEDRATEIIDEIAKLSKESSEKHTKYTWEDWRRWLYMLGEGGQTIDTGLNLTHQPPDMMTNRKASHQGSFAAEPDWEWTWLSDTGPLFSSLSETEWLIDKLCLRLQTFFRAGVLEAAKRNDSETIDTNDIN